MNFYREKQIDYFDIFCRMSYIILVITNELLLNFILLIFCIFFRNEVSWWLFVYKHYTKCNHYKCADSNLKNNKKRLKIALVSRHIYDDQADKKKSRTSPWIFFISRVIQCCWATMVKCDGENCLLAKSSILDKG